MRITLVCNSGITTSILARKLSDYAKNNNYDDIFEARRVGFYSDALADTDLVLIAPQAVLIANALIKEATKIEIPIIFLEEEDIVLGNTQKMYREINRHRTSKREYPIPKLFNVFSVFGIFKRAAWRCLPFLLLGIIALLFERTNILNLESIAFFCINMLHFYLAFAIGYEYGQFIGRREVSYGLLFLISSTLILSIESIVIENNGLVLVRSGYLSVMNFTLNNYIMLMIVCIITMLVLHSMRKIELNKSLKGNPIIYDILDMPFRYGIVLVTMLILRFFISLFFR